MTTTLTELTTEERAYIEKLCDIIENRDIATLKTMDYFRTLSDVQLEEWLAEMSAIEISREERLKSFEETNCELKGLGLWGI